MTDNITTPGAILIKNMLPSKKAQDEYDLYSPLDKGGVSRLVNNLIRNAPGEAHTTINKLGSLFFNTATDIGATTPLEDYINDSDERHATLNELESKTNEVLAKKDLSTHDRDKQLGDLAAEYRSRIGKANLAYMLGKHSVVAQMSNVGARATTDQLAQATYSPLMAAGIKGNPIPIVVKHSFAEGLTSAEHLATSYSGRASTVLAQLSTQYPGALFKKLTPSVFHEVITVPDCGTTNGVLTSTDDKLASLGKFEAGTNHLVTEQYLREKVSDGRKTLRLRNVMTCEAKQGLCQKCYGLAASGKLPPIGFNVGVIAAQSVSEVLTQAMLSVKHTGSGAGARRNAYEAAANLLNNPKQNFQDEATISSVNGRVTKVHKTALNDYNILVGETPHFVNRLEAPIVAVGDEVKIGDPLSTGVINPRSLTELKGAGAGRQALSKQLRHVYSNGTNKGLDPRHFDIIARNLIKYVKVKNPGLSGLSEGETLDIGQLNQHMKEHSKKIPLANALNKSLAVGTSELTPGTVLTSNHLNDLASQGVKEVSVSTDGLTVQPIVPGLQTSKHLDPNWISRLAFNHLKDTIQDAAALHQTSKVHSTDPITGYVIGNEFGDGERGEY